MIVEKNEKVERLYEIILRDTHTFETLRKELSHKSQLDKNFIEKKLVPIALENNLDISWQDILEYEKNHLNTKKILSLSDLEKVSGGKTSKVMLGCSLLALLGFSSLTSNVVSAEFIPFTDTKEFVEHKDDDDTTLGAIPFYLQADHVVDGVLWFKHPTKNLAFFILDRKIKKEGNKEEYTYSDYEQVKNSEYKLLDVDKLDGALKLNFDKAKDEKFDANSESNNRQSIQLAEDNPLFNFSRFYNKNYVFDDESQRGALSKISMYAGTEKDNFIQIDWDEEIKNDKDKLVHAERVKEKLDKAISWKIVHRRESDQEPSFYQIESARTLNIHYNLPAAHTASEDKNILRNDAFTFFTLCAIPTDPAVPIMFSGKENLQETVLDFTDIPLVSVSIDMLSILNPGASNIFHQDGESSSEKVPCFNGSSEEVKYQLEVYYVNEKIMSLKKEDCTERKVDEHVKEILQKINSDCLEIRIPTKARIKSWHKFEKKE